MCHIYIIDGGSIRHTGNTNNVRIQYPNISTHLDVCMATIQSQNERFLLTGMHHGTNVYQAYIWEKYYLSACMYSVAICTIYIELVKLKLISS